MTVPVAVLVAVAVAAGLLSAAGVLLLRTVNAKLHYLGPVGTFGAPLAAAAVVLDRGFGAASFKALLAALITLLSGPVVAHATARAVRILKRDGWEVLPSERKGRE